MNPKSQTSPEHVLDKYRLTSEPYYLNIKNEAEIFEKAYKSKLPVMLKGPTGCGKTRFVQAMAYRLGRPIITVACHEDLSATDLVGRFLLEGEETVWHDGPLTKAVRAGAICYLDEVVEARKDTVVIIHPLTDDRRRLPIDHARLGQVAHVLIAQHRRAGDPRQDRRRQVAGHDRSVPRHDVGVVGRPLGDEPVLDHPGVVLARRLRHHLAPGRGEQLHGLDVPPPPADVRHRDHPDPVPPRRRIGQRPPLREADEPRRRRLRPGKVAVGSAARDLDIDHPLVDRVPRDELPVHRLDARVVERRRHPELAERAMQPREVPGEVDEPPAEHARHLVDRVGEQEPAVEDADLRLLLRHVVAVDIDDAAHLTPRAPAPEHAPRARRTSTRAAGPRPGAAARRGR